MDPSSSDILEQIRRLPPEEQFEVVEKILIEFGNPDDALTPEEVAELERRADEALKNPGSGIPLEQVRDEVRQRFGWQ